MRFRFFIQASTYVQSRAPFKFLVVSLLAIYVSGCSLLEPKPSEDVDSAATVKNMIDKPLSPEQTGELLEEVGGNWLYGQGVGETTVTIGSIILFPPLAILHLGNAAISYSGYKPLGVSYLLSDEDEKGWNSVYDGVMSGPGRVIAGVSGKEYRSKEVIKRNMRKYYVEPAPENYASQRQLPDQGQLPGPRTPVGQIERPS